MRFRPQTLLFWCLFWPLALGCAAGHGEVHVAPDESQPHISWEIRSGGQGGDGALVCGSSQPAQTCLLAASTPKSSTLATLHLLVHPAAQETSYVGFMRVPFFDGADQNIGKVNATVPPGSQPVGATVIGRVTSKPGSYALAISVDATQPGMATPLRIAQEVPVTVK